MTHEQHIAALHKEVGPITEAEAWDLAEDASETLDSINRENEGEWLEARQRFQDLSDLYHVIARTPRD